MYNFKSVWESRIVNYCTSYIHSFHLWPLCSVLFHNVLWLSDESERINKVGTNCYSLAGMLFTDLLTQKIQWLRKYQSHTQLIKNTVLLLLYDAQISCCVLLFASFWSMPITILSRLVLFSAICTTQNTHLYYSITFKCSGWQQKACDFIFVLYMQCTSTFINKKQY